MCCIYCKYFSSGDRVYIKLKYSSAEKPLLGFKGNYHGFSGFLMKPSETGCFLFWYIDMYNPGRNITEMSQCPQMEPSSLVRWQTAISLSTCDSPAALDTHAVHD